MELTISPIGTIALSCVFVSKDLVVTILKAHFKTVSLLVTCGLTNGTFLRTVLKLSNRTFSVLESENTNGGRHS